MSETGVGLSVSEAMVAFQEGLRALTSSADAEHLSWRDEDAHDDWERLAEALFDVFVAKPLRSTEHEHGPMLALAPYDFDQHTYEKLSWIEVDGDDDGSGFSLVLVRFFSTDVPFDTPMLERVDSRTGEIDRDHPPAYVPEVSRYRLRHRAQADGTATIVRQLHLRE